MDLVCVQLETIVVTRLDSVASNRSTIHLPWEAETSDWSTRWWTSSPGSIGGLDDQPLL